jgi:hypothetical protein
MRIEFHSGRSLSESESEWERMRWDVERVELIIYLQLTSYFFQKVPYINLTVQPACAE